MQAPSWTPPARRQDKNARSRRRCWVVKFTVKRACAWYTAQMYRYNIIEVYTFYFVHVAVATDWAAWRVVAYPARLGALPVAAAAAVLCVRGGIGGCDEGYRTCRRKNVFPPRAGTEPKWPDDIRVRTRFPRLETVHVQCRYALFPHTYYYYLSTAISPSDCFMWLRDFEYNILRYIKYDVST